MIRNNPISSPTIPTTPVAPKKDESATNVKSAVTTATKTAGALSSEKVADALEAVGSTGLAGQIKEGAVNRIAKKTAAITGLGSVAANASDDALSALGDTKTVVGAADAVTGTQGVGKVLGKTAQGLGVVATANGLKTSVEKVVNGEASMTDAKTILTGSRDLKNTAVAAGKAIAKYGDDGVKVAKAATKIGKSAGKVAAKVAVKTGAKTAAKAGGRFVPGMNVAIAAVDAGIAASDIKKAIDDPSAKNVAKAALGSVTALGSAAAASNIPGVSQVGAGVAVVADVAKAAVDVDWQAVGSDAKKVASQAYDKGTEMLGNAASAASDAVSSGWNKLKSWW